MQRKRTSSRTPEPLASIQRTILDTIRRPLTHSGQMRSEAYEVASRVIKPNDRLTSFQRLEIYNQQYWWRLLGAFAEDFPGVRAVLGARRFDNLAVAYLSACPSRSWTMRNLGSRLTQFIARTPALTAPYTDLTIEIASLEWAQTLAFDEPGLPTIDPQKVARGNFAQLRVGVQPYVQLLELRYPADRLLARLRNREAETAAVSNAVGKKEGRRAVRLKARRLARPLHLAVHRSECIVYFKRLDAIGYRLLIALRKGLTLERACLAAFTDESSNSPAQVKKWFTTFSALGWLT